MPKTFRLFALLLFSPLALWAQPVRGLTSTSGWRLAPVPVGLEGQRLIPGTMRLNPLSYNDRRAHVSWYIIDPLFYQTNRFNQPYYATVEDLQNNYVRTVGLQEIYKSRDINQVNLNEIIFDLVYYPTERGSYNFSPKLKADGGLATEPRWHWGGIVTDFYGQTDFDYYNVNYLDFWMMDPFLSEPFDHVAGSRDVEGRKDGRLVFDLGQITEDVMQDGRQFFENGLPTPSNGLSADFTQVGRVPSSPIRNRAFEYGDGSRPYQDVGLDGLSSAQEQIFYDSTYLALLPDSLSPEARAAIEADAAHDNFLYFLDREWNRPDVKIQGRYRRFNATESNSPDVEGGDIGYQAYYLPDTEDLNGNNTLDTTNAYYSYKIDFEPDSFKIGSNYIVDKVYGVNNATWYHFRIPFRELSHPNTLPPTGDPSFKKISFMRLYLTGFAAPVAVRFNNLALWSNLEQYQKGAAVLWVYPNPVRSQSKVKLHYSGPTPEWPLEIVDLLGRRVRSLPSPAAETDIDLAGLTAGIYYVRWGIFSARIAVTE